MRTIYIIHMGRGTGGKEGLSVAHSVVGLMRGYLDACCVFYLDIYYTSRGSGDHAAKQANLPS